jgi:hypothetical protein
VGKTAIESFSVLVEFLMNSFVFSRFTIQSNSNPLPSIAQTRGACIIKKIIKPTFKVIPMKISSFYLI